MGGRYEKDTLRLVSNWLFKLSFIPFCLAILIMGLGSFFDKQFTWSLRLYLVSFGLAVIMFLLSILLQAKITNNLIKSFGIRDEKKKAYGTRAESSRPSFEMPVYDLDYLFPARRRISEVSIVNGAIVPDNGNSLSCVQKVKARRVVFVG